MINKKNTNSKKVSIVIPAYNEEKYLPLCLDSLLNLDYPKQHIEIIVVDNGSTDQTQEIVLKYGAKLYTQPLLNIAGLRNFGVQQSQGEIIAFVDADCIVSKDWLHNASNYFNDRSIAAWGSPPSIPNDSTWIQRTWYLVRVKKEAIQEVDWLETMNLFTRKEQFLKVHGFNDTLTTCEDVDFSYRIRKMGKIISDRRIEVVHLGEAATIKEFIRKEIWRGISNLKAIKSHGLLLTEIPSISIPIYFGIVLPALFIYSVFSSNTILSFFCILCYIAPTFFVLLKIIRKKINASMQDLIKLAFLLQLYFLSRTIAVVIRKPV